MIRTVSRAVAGVAAAALAMSLGIASASAADATIVIKAKSGSQVLGFTPGVITVTTSVPGKVDFFADGVAISGCAAVATNTDKAPYTAVCTWAATKAGEIPLTAKLTPTDATIAAVTSAPVAGSVGTPINAGGQPFPYEHVGLYVDTVNGSGTPAKTLAASLQGNSCVIMSQFARGMGIVFRVYVNDYARGGAPITSNEAKVSVVIKGWDTPVVLSYGNHSGAAFWAGQLVTGEPGSGKYSTLGVVDYSIEVSMIEKPAVTKKVTETQYVAVKKNGKVVKLNGKVVYEPKKVTKTVVVSPAVMTGEKYVYTPSRWPSTSLLTLNA